MARQLIELPNATAEQWEAAFRAAEKAFGRNKARMHVLFCFASLLTERKGNYLVADIETLRSWYRAEYARRTALVESGEGRIDWLDAETRVSFSEVCAKANELGISMNVVDLRRALEWGDK